jgi:uracil-DNA glycosylase
MNLTLPTSWETVLSSEFDKPYFKKLTEFVDKERETQTVFPPENDVLNALRLTPYDQTRVFVLGQDPYHDNNQAHGLAFSVLPGIKPPPSLANIYRELATDIKGFTPPKHGYLVHWAKQGVLLLNAVLTVRAHEPNSHKGKGWETFTDRVIKAVSDKQEPVVFVLWGGYAQKKLPLIDATRHTILQSAHPSPLSARSGFFGSSPFSQINAQLQQNGTVPIDWHLPQTVSVED